VLLEADGLSAQPLATSLIVLPVILAIISAFSYNKALRYAVVYSTFILLTLISAWLLTYGPFTLTYPPSADLLVTILDFLLLFYFLYIGFIRKHVLVILLTLLQIAPLAYFEAIAHEIHVSPTIIVDYLSITMCLIICVIGSLICVYALSYMEEHEEHLHLKKTRQPRFFFYMILFLGAMNGVVLSNNVYWLYFFWEVTTLCCYQLIRHDETEQAEKNALLALWMGLIGGVAFVVAMFVGLLELNTLAIFDILRAHPSIFSALFLALLSLAAFTKSAQVPFHSWLLGAMIAPTPVSALLHSSTMVKAGVYLILRIAPGLRLLTPLSYAVASVGALSFLTTSILAISQRESKRILAYSTIGNLGLIILCAGINTPLTLLAAMLLLVFHAMSKGLLFLGAGIVENRVLTRNIEDWEGLLMKYPLTTTIMLIGMAMMFLPPFGMLLGKWLAIEAVASSPISAAISFVIILVIGGAATTLFWSKWMAHMLCHPPTLKQLKVEKLPIPYIVSTFSITALDIIFSALAAIIVAALALPALKPWYSIGLSLPLLNILLSVGSFVTWPLMAALALVLIIAWAIAKSKKGIVAPPYLCGEHIEQDPYSFTTTADKPIRFDVANIFFDKSLGEPRLNKIITAIGVLLLILVFSAVV